MTGYPEYLRFIATLTAVLDPFLAVPIFLGVAASRDAASRQRLANAVVLTVFVVLAGAAIFGEALLKFLGASLPAFQVGGGLVLHDEQHLVVVRRARPLGAEQLLEAEIAAVGGLGAELGDDAFVFAHLR